MDHFDVENALSTFRVIVDTREQNTLQARKRFKDIGVPIERHTLSYGDYCANIDLPGGAALYLPGEAIKPKLVIERKMSLDELAACFTRGRARFQREFERAAAAGARVILLVEDGNYEGILFQRYHSRFTPQAYLASLTAWTIRYGMTPVFCKANTSGRLIREFLYRDMKERLEKGEFG